MVPEGWNLCKLKELALVERGKFSVRPRNDPKYYGGHIPFVQTGDVSAAGTFLTEYSQTLNDEGLKVSKLFPKDSILITIAANIGDTAITTFNVACPDSVVAIQSYDNKSDYFWLKNVLETFKEQLDAQATQNAQKNINLQVLKPLLIKTPPLPEQKKIARILSTWDKAIKTVEKLIENSKAQKKALMQQLLTGKRRLPGFEGEWEEVHLADICIVNPKKPACPQDGKVSFVSMGAVSEDAKLLRHEVRQYCEVEKGFTAFENGDVLVAKITPCFENGKGAYVDGLINRIGFGSTEFHIFRVKSKICSKFTYYLTNTREFRYRGKTNMQGSAGQKRVPTDFLKSYKTTVPSNLEEQQKIAMVLSAADREIEVLQHKCDCLKQEKKALMQQLLTGRRRVYLSDSK